MLKKLRIGQINKALREVQKDLMLGTIPKEAFDMATMSSDRCGTSPGSFCGTAACIGGHVALKLDVSAYDFVVEADLDFVGLYSGKYHHLTPKIAKLLNPLFYPDDSDVDWSKLTPAQGVLAIENYFNHKTDPWKGVIV